MKSKIKEQTALEQTLAFIQVDPSLDSSRLRSFCLHNSVPHSAADQSQHRRYLPSDQSEARDFRTKLSKPNCCLKAASSIISQEREKNRLTSPRVRLGMIRWTDGGTRGLRWTVSADRGQMICSLDGLPPCRRRFRHRHFLCCQVVFLLRSQKKALLSSSSCKFCHTTILLLYFVSHLL